MKDIFPPVKTPEEIKKQAEEWEKSKARLEAMTPEELNAYYDELEKKIPPIRILDYLDLDEE